MFTGKMRFALFPLVAALSTLLLLSCGDRNRAREILSVSKKLADVKNELSGIWYHSKYEGITTPMEGHFSWGLSTYDYWKSLRIDLLDDQKTLGFAYAIWNDVTFETDPTNNKVVKLHLRQKENPEKEEATITIEGEGVMTLIFTTDTDIEMTSMIAGKYFRVLDPGRQK